MTKILTGMARALFLFGCGLLAVAMLFFYGAYRLARAALVGAKPMPVRESGFALIVALVAFARAVQAQAASAGAVEADEDASSRTAPHPVGGGDGVRVDAGGSELSGGDEHPHSAFAATSDALPS